MFDGKAKSWYSVVFWRIPLEDFYIKHMSMKLRLMSRRMAPQKSGEGRNGRNSVGFKPFSSSRGLPHTANKAMFCFAFGFSQAASAGGCVLRWQMCFERGRGWEVCLEIVYMLSLNFPRDCAPSNLGSKSGAVSSTL